MAKTTGGSMHADDILENQPETQATEPEAKPESYGSGKYKSAGDLDKGYGELSSKYDAQGGEIGELRAQNKELTGQLVNQGKEADKAVAQAADAPPSTDYEKMQRDIAQRVDAGEIDVGAALQESNALTAQMVQENAQVQIDGAMEKAQGQFQKTLQDRDNQATYDKFNEQNPEFTQMQQDGTLEKIRAENPMHDDFSAFFQAKANAAHAAGMAEQAKITAGSENAGQVSADPGTAMQTPQKKPVGEAAVKASMMAAFE